MILCEQHFFLVFQKFKKICHIVIRFSYDHKRISKIRSHDFFLVSVRVMISTDVVKFTELRVLFFGLRFIIIVLAQRKCSTISDENNGCYHFVVANEYVILNKNLSKTRSAEFRSESYATITRVDTNRTIQQSGANKLVR